jgi:hypothetical protein
MHHKKAQVMLCCMQDLPCRWAACHRSLTAQRRHQQRSSAASISAATPAAPDNATSSSSSSSIQESSSKQQQQQLVQQDELPSLLQLVSLYGARLTTAAQMVWAQVSWQLQLVTQVVT